MLNKENLSIDDLLKSDKNELAELFENCQPFDVAELSGPYDGVVINGNLLFNLKVGKAITNKIWRGKVFYPENKIGKNILALGFFKLDMFKFKTAMESSMDFEGDVFTLRYKYKSSINPWPVKPIKDEMRKIRDDFYIGTGNIKILGKYFLFDWYVLKK